MPGSRESFRTFATSREAKEFLISSIVSEAELKNVPLSEVERQMLYYSEAYTSPVTDHFDREDDLDAYEQKIAGLIRSLRADSRTNREAYATWTKAYRTIASEDHYLLVLIKAAGAAVRPPWDRLKLIATGLAIVVALVAILYLTE